MKVFGRRERLDEDPDHLRERMHEKGTATVLGGFLLHLHMVRLCDAADVLDHRRRLGEDIAPVSSRRMLSRLMMARRRSVTKLDCNSLSVPPLAAQRASPTMRRLAWLDPDSPSSVICIIASAATIHGGWLIVAAQELEIWRGRYVVPKMALLVKPAARHVPA